MILADVATRRKYHVQKEKAEEFIEEYPEPWNLVVFEDGDL